MSHLPGNFLLATTNDCVHVAGSVYVPERYGIFVEDLPPPVPPRHRLPTFLQVSKSLYQLTVICKCQGMHLMCLLRNPESWVMPVIAQWK